MLMRVPALIKPLRNGVTAVLVDADRDRVVTFVELLVEHLRMPVQPTHGRAVAGIDDEMHRDLGGGKPFLDRVQQRIEPLAGYG